MDVSITTASVPTFFILPEMDVPSFRKTVSAPADRGISARNASSSLLGMNFIGQALCLFYGSARKESLHASKKELYNLV
jgi:hypothetical protein